VSTRQKREEQKRGTEKLKKGKAKFFFGKKNLAKIHDFSEISVT